MQFDFFATTALGLEETLAGELRSLGLTLDRIDKAGAPFRGSFEDCMRANLHLRTANRIVMSLSVFESPDPADLYEGVRAIDWGPFFPGEQTLAVSANVRDSATINNSLFAALTAKDAIVDQLRDRTGKRPNVDRYNPDVQVVVRISGERTIVGVDTSGESLHQRGYRRSSVEAPLKETLAAGLVLLSGWNLLEDFHDPMCGSGTIAIEAGLLARRIPPNLHRKRFGFMRLPWFDKREWDRILEEARTAIVPGECVIEASDQDERALGIARANAATAGAGSLIRFSRRDIREFPEARRFSTLVVNPPYGTRLGEVQSLKSLYRTMGEVFKKRLRDSTAWVFTGNAGLARYIPLKASEKLTLYNGSIRCKYIRYEVH
ncbi:MAG: THUMP domain-containing class I SAM-dependent RNA methyltransferase [Candidatus Latescibacterota bacterium]